MAEKTYVVYKEGETEPMEVFLVEVIYQHDTQAMVQVWERGSYPGDSKYKIDSPVERDDFKEALFTLSKKWDGCVDFNLEGAHYCGSVPGQKIGLMLDAAAFFCDLALAEEQSGEYGRFDNFEDALGFLNCGDGADENPGIVYRDLADEEEFIPTPMKTVTYYVPGSPWGFVMYEEDK